VRLVVSTNAESKRLIRLESSQQRAKLGNAQGVPFRRPLAELSARVLYEGAVVGKGEALRQDGRFLSGDEGQGNGGGID